MSKLLKAHINTLKKEVFFNNTKWPHFDLLFEDIERLSKLPGRNQNILSLERTGLYGGISLFAPFFEKKNFTSVDCSGKKILDRGAYNKKYVSNKKIIKRSFDYIIDYNKIYKKFKNLKKFDLILVPNLLHHIFDHKNFFLQASKLLKKNGTLYVFEPTLRELHQKPEDYFRFTPYSIEKYFKELKLKKIRYKFSGGPFTAMYYCWDQALQYLPKNLRNKYHNKINFKEMINLEKKYPKNRVRVLSSFPVSFSITGKKC